MTPLQQKILHFYETRGRDLPWRRTTDRYAIMVSEVMLQQTQVSRVIPKYEAWMERFSTVETLARATLKEVLTAWSGLGYNNRGKRLWLAAQHIVEKHKGTVPDTVEELEALPGIGPYTARSILIFADNKDLATVDTNIRRILIHELDLNEDISAKKLFAIAEDLVPKGRSRDWHNALMDYGSLELTARRSGIRPTSQQSKFKGSRRWYRGRIVKHLTTHDSLTLSQAKKKFPDCEHDLKGILEELLEENMLKKRGAHYQLP